MTDFRCYVNKCIWRINGEKNVWPNNHATSPSVCPPLLKRRLSSLGYMVFDVIDQIISDNVPVVASSRHGDTDRMMRLFECVRDKSDFSPTDFSLSVHNAIIATHAIYTKNSCMNVSLSGGKNSFSLGLMEAYALCVAEQKPVCYVYYDHPLNPFYDDLNIDDDIQTEICVACMLSCNPNDHGSSLRMHYTHTQVASNGVIDAFIQFLKNDNGILNIPCAHGSFEMEMSHESAS